jgi:hypothetical protein
LPDDYQRDAPSGVPYRFLVKAPALTISYDQIVWPSESLLLPDATENKREGRVRESDVVRGALAQGLNGDESHVRRFLEERWPNAIVPTDFHQNNASLFKLAQFVRDYESAVARDASDREKTCVFERWCQGARRFWRPELSRDDYYAEFLMADSYARIGLSENPLELAVSRAKDAPLPEVKGFTSERVRLLAAICRELQRMTGKSPFFVPTRSLGEVLGAHWTTVATWLRALEVLGVIHLAPGEVRRRGRIRSPRYHYTRI